MMMKMGEMMTLEITPSSGNVFADMGFKPAQSANLLFRATLISRLIKIARDAGLTQSEAAKKYGITQPRANALLNAKITEFSTDALVNMLARAGLTIEAKIVETKVLSTA
jgi:predicted XRE-type DNA-binding protein